MIRRAIVLASCLMSVSCIASSQSWSDYIKLVVKADPATIQALPGKIKNLGDDLDDDQAVELTTAISMALVKKPVEVLSVTNQFKASADRLQQRFGTGLICSLPLMINGTQTQVEAYYADAVPALEKVGTPAADCLNNMRATMDEFRQGNSAK
ncbi:TPA: hypothetical protein PFE29_003616 [Kluyvera ascorbata]|nr:hypothetical protein [Kluyvera ascorbata]